MFNVGDKVSFGRPNGEKTVGTIVKVNAKSLTIKQEGERGVGRVRTEGTMWRVHPSLVTKVTSAGGVTVAIKRDRDSIMREILGCFSGLSPENLWMDGEASPAQANARRKALTARLRALEGEIGHPVDESEAYRWWDSQRR